MNNEIKLALAAANNEGRKQLKNKGVISPSDSTTYQIMTAISNIDTNILDLSSIVFDDDNNICITDLENNQHKIHYDLSPNGYIVRILYDNYEIPLKYNGLELTQIEDTKIDLSWLGVLTNGFSIEAKTDNVKVYYPIYLEEKYPNYFIEIINNPEIQVYGANEIKVYSPIYLEKEYPNFFQTTIQDLSSKVNSNVIIPKAEDMSTWGKTAQANQAFISINYNSEDNSNYCIYTGVDGYENMGFSKLLKAGYKYIFSLEFYSPVLLNTSPSIAPQNIFMGFFPLNKILENANIYDLAYSSCVFNQEHQTNYYKYSCEYIPNEDIGCSLGISFGSLSDYINCEFYVKNINLIEEVNN